MDRNKHVFLAGLLALDGRLLVLLSLSRRSGFMPEQIQDVLLAVASMAFGGLHILLRLLLLHLCNEYPSLPKKKKKKTLHMLQPSDAQAALDSCIALFCAATCSQLNVSKSRGFLAQAQPLASASVAALPSISFITDQQTIMRTPIGKSAG